jgi:hypothetical protein
VPNNGEADGSSLGMTVEATGMRKSISVDDDGGSRLSAGIYAIDESIMKRLSHI